MPGDSIVLSPTPTRQASRASAGKPISPSILVPTEIFVRPCLVPSLHLSRFPGTWPIFRTTWAICDALYPWFEKPSTVGWRLPHNAQSHKARGVGPGHLTSIPGLSKIRPSPRYPKSLGPDVVMGGALYSPDQPGPVFWEISCDVEGLCCRSCHLRIHCGWWTSFRTYRRWDWFFFLICLPENGS